jgi:hypothetical protein
MADKQEQPNQLEPLGPAYDTLQRRLLDDGAAWRARLPGTERLEERLDALKDQQRAASPLASDQGSGGRLRLLPPTNGVDTMFQSRLRVALVVVSLAAVVALFAVLFYGFAAHKGANTGSGATKTATTMPTQHQYASYVPAVAPSNSQVIYKLVPRDGMAPVSLLARSTDGGATWQTFSLPTVHGGSATPLVVFVSPLNPQYVFLTVMVALPSGSGFLQPCPSSVTSSGLSGDVALSGGSPTCAVEFLSEDGGAHWQQVHLPANAAPAALGDTSGYVLAVSPLFSNGTTVFHVQGSRLYSTTNVLPGDPPNSPEAQSTTTVRIVVSTDGGLHWTYADGDLASSGQNICDYTASPSGSILFAVTSAGCNNESAPPAFLWRSDDAGAHWAEVGQLPDNAEIGMAAVSRGNGQTPLLYIDMAKETCTTSGGASLSLKPYSGVCNYDPSPANLQVSADGGQTWTAAPIEGFPRMSHFLQNPGPPLGVLSDGSLLFLGFATSNSYGFYTWKLGETSWHQVGPVFKNVVSVFEVASGKNTVCVVTGAQSAFAVSTFNA